MDEINVKTFNLLIQCTILGDQIKDKNKLNYFKTD